MNNPLSRLGRPTAALCLTLALVSYGAEMKNPDFTKGEKLIIPKKRKIRARTLGPTGIWAMMFSKKMTHGATRDTRQFLVSEVETGSPADGKIVKDDVIVGVNGKAFSTDARKALAAAIEKAEETDGTLSLRIWRAGKASDVSLKLKVMGAFNSTSPFNCPYTDAVIDALASHAKSVTLPPTPRKSKTDRYPTFPSLSALGMLAAGREDLMPQIKAYAHWLCVDKKTGKPATFEVSSQGKRVWRTAYKLIFLSEYYMATGDETVLPAIKTFGVGAAMGQSGVGSYGHRFSSRKPDGSYHGPLEGYGAINNAGISMMVGLLLARQAGVKHQELDQAIARGKRYFDFFVDHGCISYGDHWAGYDAFDNNGTSGIIAMMYGLLGDDRGQRFFGSMCVASAPTGREEGHQGCYWTHQWDTLGAARAGKDALNASFAEARYLRTLERGWNGQIIDQGNIGPDRYGSRGDVTGSRLLLYSLGRKKLYLSGKDLKVNKPLKGRELRTAIEAGRLVYNPELRKALSEKDIFELLSSELTPARFVGAKALREQGLRRVDKLIAMLDSDDRYERYGACNALSEAGFNSEKAVDAIIKRLENDEDILFRYFAVDALTSGKGKDYGLHGAASRAVPVLLKLSNTPVPNDPRQHLHWRISEALFYYKDDLLKGYLENHTVDDSLLVGALKQFLRNENGRARSMVAFDKLTDKQLEPLWGDILQATRERAPSGIMFSEGVMNKGMTVLAKHRIKEGLDHLLDLAKSDLSRKDGWAPRFWKAMFAALPDYGKDALPVLAVIEKWPILEKKNGAPIKKELPVLRKTIENAKKLSLRRVSGK